MTIEAMGVDGMSQEKYKKTLVLRNSVITFNI